MNKRKRTQLIVLSSLLLMCVLLSFSYAEADWQKISSEHMGYTVQAPESGWNTRLVRYEHDGPEYVITEESILWNENGAEISIEVWMDDSGSNISQWIDNHQSLFVFSAHELKNTIASVDKLDALRYTSDFEECGTYAAIDTFFKKENKVFRIAYLQRDEGESIDIYDHIIETFEFGSIGQTTFQLLQTNNVQLGAGYGLPQCGGVSRCTNCCGQANPAYCCDNKYGINAGNCVWWAWEQGCRVWKWRGGDIIPARNAREWAGLARARGYTVKSTPAPNTIGCWSYSDGRQHVAWVVEVRGSRVRVSEMSCHYRKGMREYEYNITAFNQGFIYPKGQIAGACGGTDVVLTGYPGSDCPAGRSLTLKPGFSTSGKTFRGYIR